MFFFSFFICVHVFMCCIYLLVWMCMHMYVEVYMFVLRPEVDIFPESLTSVFWGRVSHWTQTSSTQLDWLTDAVQGSACLYLSPVLELGHMPLCLAFYIGSGALNSRPHACVEGTSLKELSCKSLFIFLKTQNIHLGKLFGSWLHTSRNVCKVTKGHTENPHGARLCTKWVKTLKYQSNWVD